MAKNFRDFMENSDMWWEENYSSESPSDELDDHDDRWDDSHEDWRSAYRDAFEDDPEACWGREW